MICLSGHCLRQLSSSDNFRELLSLISPNRLNPPILVVVKRNEEPSVRETEPKRVDAYLCYYGGFQEVLYYIRNPDLDDSYSSPTDIFPGSSDDSFLSSFILLFMSETTGSSQSCKISLVTRTVSLITDQIGGIFISSSIHFFL